MRKWLLFLFFTILSLSYSQIRFERGYFIDSTGQKVECLIRNVDWKNNPTEFEYKLGEDSDRNTATIRTVSEFGIYGFSRYLRKKVMIDRSSEEISKMSYERSPLFKEEELFLKVLVEGEASLYGYTDGKLRRYFYDHQDSIEQLIFKSYRTPEDKIGRNNGYRRQLLNVLQCPTITWSRVQRIDYDKNELVRLFVEYNTCNDQEYVNFNEKQTLDLFNLNIRPGINRSALLIQNSVSNIRDTDFGKELSFRIGIEPEFILPFNKNKWSIIIEPTYQYFLSEKTISSQNVRAEYRSLEFPVGARHYFFLKNGSRIFINASFVFDFSGKSVIYFDASPDLMIKTEDNLALGIGFKFNDTYGVELRYLSRRQILLDYVYWNSDYQTLSFVFGYSLF